ncbi:hypothetical protein K3495_g14364 [Podosphaera aphanis]|nr:hypothetical protein K3495_g14364 [Podosphaera aphanis]
MPSSKRYAQFSEEQRRKVRNFFHTTNASTGPKPSQSETILWAKNTLGIEISQPQVSKWSSDRFKPLAAPQDKSLTTYTSTPKRRRERNLLDLELFLYTWLKQYETRAPITGGALRVKASKLFHMMPMYRDQTETAWSNGWYQRFQQLYGIHMTRRYGEASSTLACHDEEIRTIQQALADFPLRDIYNCDETGLFYKSVPEVSLTTCQLTGHKANKDRVTAMHTVSASGQVLKFWYIGTSKQSRYFKNVKIGSFNLVYRNNKKAWMNTEIMIEYLKWVDREMAGRKVVLLMDNFSTHKAAFEYLNSSPLTSLRNTSVIFLPPDITSLHQPLHQGIIRAGRTIIVKNG